jgi:Uma2 family endonuclease
VVVKTQHWTIQDLETLPDNGGWERYEIINRELHVTRAPHLRHQGAATRLSIYLGNWSESTGLGEVFQAPGVILTQEDAVIPDLVWASHDRITQDVDESGHFTLAPELVVEVLSGSASDQRRDRETKLELYSLHGVEEYWIVSWRLKTIERYQRQNNQLQQVETLGVTDTLTSPLLTGFSLDIARIFP